MGCACGKGRFPLLPARRAPLAAYEPVPVEDPTLSRARDAPTQSAASSSSPVAVAPAPASARDRKEPLKLSPLESPGRAADQLTANLAAARTEAASRLGFSGSALKEAQSPPSVAPVPAEASSREFFVDSAADKAPSELMTLSEEPKRFNSSDTRKAMAYITALKDLPPNGPVMQCVSCFLKYGVTPLLYIMSFYVWAAQKMYAVYKVLPMNIVDMLFGAALCFFGGIYFAAIAAIEAARVFGGVDLWDHLLTCWEEGTRVRAASLADDQERSERNSPELSGSELMQHKAFVALVAVKDPDRLQDALFSLANVYIAVIATLKFQFARTVAIALGIASMLTLPATRLCGPLMASVMGADLNHWVPCIIDTSIKLIAVIVASYVQAFISAFYSGLRGGRLFAKGLFNIATERGWLDHLPDCLITKPFDPDRSCLDEAIAYPIAAAGFYVQVMHGFALDFPFNLLLLPLTVVEWFLRWQVYT